MITVTGAGGPFGRQVVEGLLDRRVPPDQIVAVVRDPAKAAGLAARGVRVRHGDYDRPETLAAALAGTDRLLLVSGSEVGRRVRQHQNVVDAAVAAKVSLIVYTSILNAERNRAPMAPEHLATEQAIRGSGLPFSFLRNGWYIENFTQNLDQALSSGVIAGAAGEGRVAGALRADYAAAAAAVVGGDEHENTVYELGGDEPFTLRQYAAELSAQSGRQVTYTDLTGQEYVETLLGAGLPEPVARLLAGIDAAVAGADLDTDSRDLHRLLGRGTVSLADAVGAALKAR